MEEGNHPDARLLNNNNAAPTRSRLRNWVFTINNPEGANYSNMKHNAQHHEICYTCDEEGPHRDCYKMGVDLNKTDWDYLSD